MRLILVVSAVTTVFGFGDSAGATVTCADGSFDVCDLSCSQTVGCDQSYCKSNGVCFGLYHKDNVFCYQPGGAANCDDTILEAVKCTDYPLTTCQSVCDGLVGCKDSAWGSYCKSWQDPPVCFGIFKRYDGSLCHQSESGCEGEPYECHFANGPVQPTLPSSPTTSPYGNHNKTTSKPATGYPGADKPTTAGVPKWTTVKVESPSVKVPMPSTAPVGAMPTTISVNATEAPSSGFFSWFGF
ncbi:hypothetical protein FOL47_009461 [Perkinsus chesapeaki]|uniref:Immunoglobulin super DCC subclass member n=1 Tax=Perkinsus chesapeaki TaxID=330153 RepID=A0A7J6L864_PERCH|nr:hypothetical protein FOL47_009461 [Perkinsus chesapeaki]